MLVIGVRGLGSEVSKNIVLAGVCEVTLMDHTSLSSHDSASRFLMQSDGLNVILSNPLSPHPLPFHLYLSTFSTSLFATSLSIFPP